MTFTPRQLLLVAFAAGLLNILPLAFNPDRGGDILFHYALIDCFSSQFWQGHFLPRWCMDVNAGLGAPLFLFYFPLPYYLTALLEPLRAAGMTTEGIYILSLALAGILTVVTCFLWLKEIVSPGRALLAALLLLWMPYRSEMMFYRAAFAEIWCMALLPLAFLYTRRLAQGNVKNWKPLALTAAGCLLAHLPAALAGLFACGIYILWLASPHPKRLAAFAAAMLMAGLGAAFYLVPAKLFVFALAADAHDFHTRWTNTYMPLKDFFATQGRLKLNFLLTLTLVVGLSIVTIKNRSRIVVPFIRREAWAWMGIAGLGFVLLFDISAPLWEILAALSLPTFPWRMQALPMFAAIYLIAVKMQWLTEAKRLKTWKADYAVFVAFLALLGAFVTSSFDIKISGYGDFLTRVRQVNVTPREYRTRWIGEAFIPTREEKFFAFADTIHHRAQLVAGNGRVEEIAWNTRGIVLNADLPKEGVIRLRQYYFPLWRLTVDGKEESARLSPEPQTGLMRIDAPAGRHELRLAVDLNAAMRGWYVPIVLLSAAAVVFLVFPRRYGRSV